MQRSVLFIMLLPALLFGQMYLYNNTVKINNNNIVDDVRLVMADTIYCVVGQEMNVYFDNAVLVPDYTEYTFKVVSDSGYHYSDRWSYTPAVGAIGGFSFALFVYDRFGNLCDADTALVVIAPDLSSGDNVILWIGDSLIDQYTLPHEVSTLAGEYLNFIGRKDSTADSTNNEGLGGMSWSTYESNAEFSPFVSDGHVNFRAYLTAESYDDPDFVVFTLGTNDMYSATEKTDAQIETVLQYADSLINKAIVDIPNVKVGVCLLNPPSKEQDAFGDNYHSAYSRGIYIRNRHRYNELLIARYGTSGTKKNAQVSLIPTNLNLDAVHNMKTSSKAYNSRNSTTYSRQTNALHPATDGYEQMADTVYGWIANKW